jgi:hypothetical protein
VNELTISCTNIQRSLVQSTIVLNDSPYRKARVLYVRPASNLSTLLQPSSSNRDSAIFHHLLSAACRCVLQVPLIDPTRRVGATWLCAAAVNGLWHVRCWGECLDEVLRRSCIPACGSYSTSFSGSPATWSVSWTEKAMLDVDDQRSLKTLPWEANKDFFDPLCNAMRDST